MVIKDFTQPEIDYIIEKCNFTDEEKRFFLLRAKGTTLEGIAEIMNFSVGTSNNYSKRIKKKIIRII